MRLWHYKLIPVLPKKQLISQWRECISIKRRWEQDKPDSPLIMYVRNYDKELFIDYVCVLIAELNRRNIKWKEKYFNEFVKFCDIGDEDVIHHYPEHNDRYLKQCYYNLQEKFDRGLITEEEWLTIYEYCKDIITERNYK